MGISYVENVPKKLLPVCFFNYSCFDTLFFTLPKILGGGGEAQAPSAPPPASGLIMTKKANQTLVGGT